MAEIRIAVASMFGPVPAGGPSAGALREELERHARADATLIVDMTGVEDIAPSFADELFGKLPLSVSADQLRYENLSAHLRTVSKRAGEARRAAAGG